MMTPISFLIRAQRRPAKQVPSSHFLSPTETHFASLAILHADPPKSKAQIAREHHSRAERESAAYNARLSERYHELSQFYEEMLDDEVTLDEDELPNDYDGVRLFDALATKNDARALIHSLNVWDHHGAALERARHYTFNVRCALAALLPPPAPGQGHAHQKETRGALRDALARPTAFFACDFPECRGDHGFEWPEINWHWRDAHADESVWIPEFEGLRSKTRRRNRLRATMWAEGAELANRILDAAGLPQETRMHRLDKLCKKGRLYCACGDPDLSDVLCWGQLVCLLGGLGLSDGVHYEA